jgi:tRNA pseudouridine38-40 synthase
VPHFKVTLAYDGSEFVGWQRQASGTSIQGLLEQALRELDQREVPVVGAGRTDAGVHARGQVASFSLVRPIEAAALVGAVNARLPEAVRITHAEIAPASFHARFDAVEKLYRYRIWNTDVLDPFERRYAWHLLGSLDRDAMNRAAQLIRGRHDFAAFQAAGSSARSSVREIFTSKVIAGLKPCATADIVDATADVVDATADVVDATADSVGATAAGSGAALQGCGPLIVYEVSADGFLRHMVRAIVGTLVEIGRGRRSIAWMGEVLDGCDRARAGPTAPPDGLVLVSVGYSSEARGGAPRE